MQLVLSLEKDSWVSAGVRFLRCWSSAQSFCSEMFRTCCWKLFPAQCCRGQLGFLTLTGSTLEDYWADSGSDSLLQINGSDTRLVWTGRGLKTRLYVSAKQQISLSFFLFLSRHIAVFILWFCSGAKKHLDSLRKRSWFDLRYNHFIGCNWSDLLWKKADLTPQISWKSLQVSLKTSSSVTWLRSAMLACFVCAQHQLTPTCLLFSEAMSDRSSCVQSCM